MKLIQYVVICIALVSISNLLAIVTVYNTTDRWIFAGVYYYENRQNAELHSAMVAIAPQESGQLQEPSISWVKDRYLVFDNAPLKSVISYLKFATIGSKRVRFAGDYFIVEKDGRLKGYSWLEQTITKPVKHTTQSTISFITEPIKLKIIQNKPAFLENSYQTTTAQVRISNELVPDERLYLEKRLPKVQSALEKLLGRPLTGAYIPKIALIGSGGGYRATLCTTGSLVGASTIGLLDATTYITALSGSTWALGPWMASGLSITQFKEELIGIIHTSISSVLPSEMSLISDALMVKAVLGQTLTLVDLFGALLANRLLRNFGERRHLIYLSQQIEWIKHGDRPFPIYTAIDGRSSVIKEPHWYEFTPYEIGSPWLGLYVPTWGFGRKFINGSSVDFAPEQDFGFLLGIFGSAFALSLSDVWKELKNKVQNTMVKSIIEILIDPIHDKRASWGAVHNFSAAMAASKIKNDRDIRLVDGGLECNLPYAPVSGDRPERLADIMIFLDASKSVIDGTELRKVEAYARRQGLKFPVIDYTDIDKRVISVFKNEKDSSVPVVVYMPRINDSSILNKYKNTANFKIPRAYSSDFNVETCVEDAFCGTFNFVYSAEQAYQLTAVTEFNMYASKQVIIDAIN